MNNWKLKTRFTCALLALALMFAPLAVYAQDEPGTADSDSAAGSTVEPAAGSAPGEATPPPKDAKKPNEVAGPDAGQPEQSKADKSESPDRREPPKEPAEKLAAAVVLIITAEEYEAEEPRAALDWSMRSRLEENYRLLDPKRVSQLEHQAATATEKENCTSEQCLLTLKRRLVMDRLFAVSIVPDGETTQVNLTLLTGDDKILRSDVCNDCSLGQMRDRMLSLLDELIVADQPKPELKVVEEKPELEAVAAEIPAPPEEEKQDKGGGFSMPWWAYAAAGVLLLAVVGGGGGDSGGGGGSGSGSGSVGVEW